MKTISFCVTHDIPKTPISEETFIVWLGEKNCPFKETNKTIIVRDLFDDLDFYRNFLLGSAGTIAIKRYITESGIKLHDDTLIQIFSYRKLISKDPIGIESKTYPSMRILRNKEIIKEKHILQTSESYLVAMPVKFANGYLGQYCLVHHAEDFLRYSTIATELGIINSRFELPIFFNYDSFIPGGCELGVFPLDVFVKITEKIERVSLHYCDRYRPVSLDKYQKRAVSFCNERLSSYLLLKEISKRFNNNPPKEIWGYIVTIDEENNDYIGNRW